MRFAVLLYPIPSMKTVPLEASDGSTATSPPSVRTAKRRLTIPELVCTPPVGFEIQLGFEPDSGFGLV
jgi:hypothetical protein